MPAFVLKNAKVLVDTVDISDSISNVSVEMTTNPVEVTSMGNIARKFSPGLREDRMTLTAFNDFSLGTASSLYYMLATKYNSGGTFQVDVYPNQSGAGTTKGTANPCFTGYASLYTFNPFAGNIGDAATTPLEFRCNGTISVATS